MRIRLTAILRVREESSGKAEAIIRALKPDDVAPRGEIKLSSMSEGENIHYTVEISGGPEALMRLRNTLDDILEHIELAERILEEP